MGESYINAFSLHYQHGLQTIKLFIYVIDSLDLETAEEALQMKGSLLTINGLHGL